MDAQRWWRRIKQAVAALAFAITIEELAKYFEPVVGAVFTAIGAFSKSYTDGSFWRSSHDLTDQLVFWTFVDSATLLSCIAIVLIEICKLRNRVTLLALVPTPKRVSVVESVYLFFPIYLTAVGLLVFAQAPYFSNAIEARAWFGQSLAMLTPVIAMTEISSSRNGHASTARPGFSSSLE